MKNNLEYLLRFFGFLIISFILWNYLLRLRLPKDLSQEISNLIKKRQIKYQKIKTRELKTKYRNQKAKINISKQSNEIEQTVE